MQVWPWKRQISPLLGIDISSACVKMLELSYANGRFCVENYAVTPFPPGIVEDKQIKDPAVATGIIRKTYEKSGSSATQAAIAIPDSSVITKIVQLEADLNDQEMEEFITAEASKYIPYPLEEVSFDFSVLGPVEKRPELVNILIVASRKEKVELLAELVEDSGLSVRIVDVESYAVQRTHSLIYQRTAQEQSGQTVAIFDIGAFVTNLTVLHNGETIFSREEFFGGEKLTKDVQKHYGLSYAEAGLAKKSGGLPDDYHTEILTPFIEAAVVHIRRALQFFYSTSDIEKINNIRLAGGTAVLPGLVQMIEKQINIPTEIADPFVGMQMNRRVDTIAIQKDAPSLMVCCGLAMRGLLEAVA